jgi:hypothetical protein
MTITPKALYTGGQLTGSATVLYTCPLNTTAVVTGCTFTNTDTTARTVTVYVVRSGASPGAANALISALSIAAPPAAPYTSPEMRTVTLSAGDSIRAFADVGAKVTVASINGYEIS